MGGSFLFIKSCEFLFPVVNRAQIEDIVKRKTGIAAENIVITPLKEGEDVAEGSVDTAVTRSKSPC